MSYLSLILGKYTVLMRYERKCQSHMHLWEYERYQNSYTFKYGDTVSLILSEIQKIEIHAFRKRQVCSLWQENLSTVF